MNKEQATKILSKELAKVKGQKFIVNSAYQKDLLEKALYCYLVEHDYPFLSKSSIGRLSEGEFVDEPSLKQVIEHHKQALVSHCKSSSISNYIFIDHSEHMSTARNNYGTNGYFCSTDVLSFFALITPQDAEEMKNMFYKNVPLEIVCAMDTLGIMHFIKEYEVYKNTDNFPEALEILKFSKRLTDFISKDPFDRDSEISKSNLESVIGGIDLLNNRFTSLGIKVSINTQDYRQSSSQNYIHKKNLLQVVDEVNKKLEKGLCQTPEKFYNFVFNLPYEYQNVESNKAILKLAPENFDYVQVLIREYSNGKHFQDYFDCLDAERQKKVVDSLKSVSVKNHAHNSFLWKKGFKDVDVDYMALYKTDSESFIDYFAGRTTDEKRIILKDIMDSDFVNEKVTVWLNDGYLDLMREVGFNG